MRWNPNTARDQADRAIDKQGPRYRFDNLLAFPPILPIDVGRLVFGPTSHYPDVELVYRRQRITFRHSAEQSSDRVQINRDIFVEPGQKSGDLVCINCSIFVRGETTGDVVTVHGNVIIEQAARVAGGVTTVLGDVRIQSAAQIAGDLTIVGGKLHRDPQATVAGDVTSLEGVGWTLLIVLPPLAFLGGLIALIIWLVARVRRPKQVAA
jgi:hypothetical protein